MKEETIKQVLFGAIIIILLFVAVSMFIFKEIILSNLLWIALLFIFFLIITQGGIIVKLKEFERSVIFRMGKYNRVGGPGWIFMIPKLEDMKIVDLRTQVLDIDPQKVITKDNIEVQVDAVVYEYIEKDDQSVKNSVIEIKDYKEATGSYIKGAIRDIIGSMTLNELISQTELITDKLIKKLTAVSKNWGVKIESVQITDIRIPEMLREAMTKEKASEREKLQRIQQAEATKLEIDAVREAAERLSDKAISYYYIKALEKIADGRASKIIFPVELSRLAEGIAGKMGGGSSASNVNKQDIESELMQKYKQVLKEFNNQSKELNDQATKHKKEIKQLKEEKQVEMRTPYAIGIEQPLPAKEIEKITAQVIKENPEPEKRIYSVSGKIVKKIIKKQRK